MAAFVFNVAKGAVAEKARDDNTKFGVMVLRAASIEGDGTLRDKVTLTDLVSGATDEATNTNYARKTGITGTLTVDQSGDLVKVTIPDQSWADVAAGDNWAKIVVFYEESASDGSRIPLTCHDFAITPDGSSITATMPSTGVFSAS